MLLLLLRSSVWHSVEVKVRLGGVAGVTVVVGVAVAAAATVAGVTLITLTLLSALDTFTFRFTLLLL